MIFEARNESAAVDDRHARAEPGQEVGLFHRGVAAADDDDLLVAEEEPVARRAVRDAAPASTPSRRGCRGSSARRRSR